MKILLLIVSLIFTINTQAFEAYSGTTDLGLFNKIKCSTGVTCTNVLGKLNIVSSPTLVGPLTLESGEIINNTLDDTIELKSNDENTTLQITGFEAKTAVLNLWADQGDDAADKFSLTATVADTLVLKNSTTTLATVDSSGNVLGIGSNNISGFLNKQVAITSVAITAAQCGSTFVGDSADVIVLPEASTVLGCRLTFVAGTADDVDINPADATDVIGSITASGGTITPSAGDAIRMTDVGTSVVLQAVSANLWVAISHNGPITDVN